MKLVLKWLQIIGMLLVGIGLWHGLFDSNGTQGMWQELWYLLTGAGLFYGSMLLLRRMR